MPDAQHHTPLQPEKIHALTSLRFFAAFMVMLYHTTPAWIPGWTAIPVLPKFTGMGFTAVPFFFLLSGYILAVVYLRRDTPINKSAFFTARFARIYPLFLLTLIADTPNLFSSRVYMYGLHSDSQNIGDFCCKSDHAARVDSSASGIDNPNWSLATETVFYISFPFLAPALWRLRSRGVWILSILLWTVSQICIYLLSFHLNEGVMKNNPLLHMPTFLLGILLARWQTLQQATHRRSPGTSLGVWIGLFFAVSGFCAVTYWQDSIPPTLIGHVLLAPVFACAIWVFSANDHIFSKLLSFSWLIVLGEASYGLYLIHIPVAHFWEWMGWSKITSLYPVYLLTPVILSVFSFYFVETPARRWILKRFHTRPKETLEAASDA